MLSLLERDGGCMDGWAGWAEQKRASGADWHACDFRIASDRVGRL